MDSTDGIPRGADVHDTGEAITVPVGEQTLGRLFNVLGDTIDRREEKLEVKERWPIHRDPPTFESLKPTLEIFETGIKVVDLLAPYVKGGKVGLFGGRRWRDGADSGADPQHRRGALEALSVFCGVGELHSRGQRPVHRDDRVRRHRQDRAWSSAR